VEGELLAAPEAFRTPPGAARAAPLQDLRSKKNLAFLTVPLEFPEANADTDGPSDSDVDSLPYS